jgi:hypothetical protein
LPSGPDLFRAAKLMIDRHGENAPLLPKSEECILGARSFRRRSSPSSATRGKPMKAIIHRAQILAIACAAGLILASCGKSVSGSTYEGTGGAFTVEFQSGGKAVTTIAGQKADCTYTEDSKSVTLTCAGQPLVFTINDDGSLSGPLDSMMGKLTKKQS